MCLRGAPQYLLIKASVCVCLFISGCYSRRSPVALMRHKPALPTEAYTLSCHCTSTHSKPCHNKILSHSTYTTLESCIQTCLSVPLYMFGIVSCVFPSSLSVFSVMNGMLGVFPYQNISLSFFYHLHLFFPPCKVHLHFHSVFNSVTPLPPTKHLEAAKRTPSGGGK